MTVILTTATDIQAIVGTICAIITTILIPVVAYFFKQKRKNTKRNEIIDAVPNALDDIKTGISDIKEDQNVIKYNQQLTDHRISKLEKRYDALETQQLKSTAL